MMVQGCVLVRWIAGLRRLVAIALQASAVASALGMRGRLEENPNGTQSSSAERTLVDSMPTLGRDRHSKAGLTDGQTLIETVQVFMNRTAHNAGTVRKFSTLRHARRIPAERQLVHQDNANVRWLRPAHVLPFLSFELVPQGLHGRLQRPRRRFGSRKTQACFVLDTRRPPRQARWLHAEGPLGGRGGPGDLLCDLIDLLRELHGWQSMLAASGAASTRQLLDFTAAPCLTSRHVQAAVGPHDLLAWVSSTRVVCDESGNRLRTRPAVLELLHQLQRRYIHDIEVTAQISRADFDSGEWAVSHPFKSALLHALDRRGTVDLDLRQLNQLCRELPHLWLRTFTRPAAAHRPVNKHNPAILLVPGALRVLR